MKQWLYRLTLRQKIIASFITIVLVAVLSMNIVSHTYYSRATEQDFYNIAETSTIGINHQIEIYFQQIAKSTYAMNAGVLHYSSVLLEKGDSSLIQDWLRDDSLVSLEKRAMIRDMLNKYISFNYPEIENMYLMSKDQRVLQAIGVSSEVQLSKQPWFNQPLSTELRIYPTFNVAGSSIPFIAVSIPIFDIENTTLSGNLLLNMRLTEIRSIIGNTKIGETGYIFMVSEDNKIVYHPQASLIAIPLADSELKWLSLEQTNSLQRWNGEQYLVSYSTSYLTGWKTIALVPLKEMATGLQVARISAIVVMGVLILLILITVPLVAGLITRPIIHLKQAMEKLQTGDLTVRAPVMPGRDEIQLLSIKFNRMAERLQELVTTVNHMELKEVQLQLLQKEAMIRALQNQINPHLLYNTLDIIKSIAFLEDVPKIERMATNLASLYRFSAKFEHAEITLAEELEHLKRYLEIIHVRYTRHFESKVYVDEKYIETAIIKLSLQPLVENAIKYAVEPRNGKAAVIVSAFPEGNDLIIEIADNGPGIESERLQELQERIKNIRNMTSSMEQYSQSLGLTNVHHRLVLTYGENYGIEVHSFLGKGTVVSVRIPFKRKDNIS